MNYQSLVMMTAAVVVASAEAKSIAVDKKLTGRPVIGGFALGIFLFIFGMASQNVGAKFCYLVLITAILKNGDFLIAAINPTPRKAN